MPANHPPFTSDKDNWETPPLLFAAIQRKLQVEFDLDPCASKRQIDHGQVLTPQHYGLPYSDGLSPSWAGKAAYVNPPYGSDNLMDRWLPKVVAERDSCPVIAVLIPAHTDTRYWHRWVMPYAAGLIFIKGRVNFVGGSSTSTFPSVVVVFSLGFRGMTAPMVDTMERPA